MSMTDIDGSEFRYPKLGLVGTVRLTEKQKLLGIAEDDKVGFYYPSPKEDNDIMEKRNVILSELESVN